MRQDVARTFAAGLDAWEQTFSPWLRRAAMTSVLLVVFGLSTAERLVRAVQGGTVGIDLRIYRAAAATALAGGDPWSTSVNGLTFAGPPPSLLPYLPAALLPEAVAFVLYGALAALAALVVLRALHVPIWWLLFPPLSDSLIVLSPDVIVVALLVALPSAAALAVVLKVYAAVPLLLTARWRALIIGLGLCLLSVPWWQDFYAARDTIAASLQAQSFGGLSAWGSLLMVPTLLALAVLFRRGAEWMSVPAVWPATQLHYSVLALPIAARSATVAVLLSFAVWPLPAIATLFYAAQLLIVSAARPYRVDRSPRQRPGAESTEPSTSV